MKKSIYPNTIGVPRLALVGVSGVGKSSLASKLLPRSISSAAKIVGNSSAQTTLIPTHFYINENSEHTSQLQLRITLRSFLDNDIRVDEDAVFFAIQHSITSFAKGSKSSGLPLSALTAYIDSGKYAEDLHVNVNGAVRLEQLKSEAFQHANACAKLLLENFDTSEVDSSVSKMKGDAEKEQAKIIALRDILRQRWDSARKQKDSRVCALLREIEQELWERMERLLSESLKECETATFSFDMDNEEDRKSFTALLDPYSPLSLIIEKYEVACGMGTLFSNEFKKQLDSGLWLDSRLPFRLVLVDSVGLTQDTQESDYDIAKRLRAVLNSGCQGILLMLPAGLRDENMRTIQRRFSSESEEGRQIKRNHIPVFLGIARADEEITPQVEAEEDEAAFTEEMRRIWARLSGIRDQWKTRFRAEDARFLTNQPKKITAYLNDLDNMDDSLVKQLEESLGNRSALYYLFKITATLQKNLFNSEKPIFFKVSQPETDGFHFLLHVVSHDAVKEMASTLAQISSQYHITQWLHWNTAYAFRDSVYNGYKFVSRAVKNGRISIYIDGDVKKAAHTSHWTFTAFTLDQIELKNIDLLSSNSASLYEALKLSPSSAGEIEVKCGLKKLFIDNFTKEYSWRFWRAMDRAIRRLSYEEPRIKAEVFRAFESGRFTQDASNGVEQMLDYYRSLYQNPHFVEEIEHILNEELSKEFNNFFFPLY